MSNLLGICGMFTLPIIAIGMIVLFVLTNKRAEKAESEEAEAQSVQPES